jgi:aryl-alcohol dehydrogenase-like predicted oxidoreductase
MKTVELTKGIHSSVIGFGCAPVLGAVDAKTAKHAIELALDHGVNHLDLARSYGYGEAERFVGKIIKLKRHELVVASKFGIRANWKAHLLRSAKPLIRTLRKSKAEKKTDTVSSTQANTKNVASLFFDRIAPLRGKDMRNSLEKSLSELGSDYLDYFFIHEPLVSLTHSEELSETAEILKAEGKIRAWGLAYMQSQEQLHQSYLNVFDILQFNNPPSPAYDGLVSTRGMKPNIIFSPIRGGSPTMRPAEKIKKALTDFPNSVMLCSMFNPEHIKQNIRIAAQAQLEIV